MKSPTKSPLMFLVFTLIIIGLIFISISSLSEATNSVGDKFFFLRKQIIWLLISLVAFYICSKINLEKIKKFFFPLYIFSIITLILVIIPGLSDATLGAHRWLNLGFIKFQPSEILKLSLVLFLSQIFSKSQNLNLKNLIFFLGIPFILIIIEPNLSTAILISTISISLYYLAGGKIGPLFGFCAFLISLSLILIFISPYRSARLKTMLNPTQNQETASYHSNQIVLTLSSGGFFGKGFANSDQKYSFLPKISTDSILAVIGEEVGFIGLLLVLLVYISLISYLFKLSHLISDPFQSLLISGTSLWIAYQSLINISAIAGIIPLTGVPLPFISYGGSSLSTLMVAIGLIRNIEKNNPILLYSNHESKDNKVHHHYRHSSHPRTRTNPSIKK
ncbi:MAG: putative peptidoglycan glycosyltransferase FtsW [Candidatus Shapirobacteria bacterium]|nr:putative peptidoglycan glycosyltransferase FtsW [Candidatus Shapirobacteria bacterium]